MENNISLFNCNSNLSSDNQFADTSDQCYPIVSYSKRLHDFTIDMYAPGFYKDDLDLEINGNLLCISGRHRYSNAYFTRNIKLPDDVAPNNFYYCIKNGHIKVTFQVLD